MRDCQNKPRHEEPVKVPDALLPPEPEPEPTPTPEPEPEPEPQTLLAELFEIMIIVDRLGFTNVLGSALNSCATGVLLATYLVDKIDEARLPIAVGMALTPGGIQILPTTNFKDIIAGLNTIECESLAAAESEYGIGYHKYNYIEQAVNFLTKKPMVVIFTDGLIQPSEADIYVNLRNIIEDRGGYILSIFFKEDPAHPDEATTISIHRNFTTDFIEFSTIEEAKTELDNLVDTLLLIV